MSKKTTAAIEQIWLMCFGTPREVATRRTGGVHPPAQSFPSEAAARMRLASLAKNLARAEAPNSFEGASKIAYDVAAATVGRPLDKDGSHHDLIRALESAIVTVNHPFEWEVELETVTIRAELHRLK